MIFQSSWPISIIFTQLGFMLISRNFPQSLQVPYIPWKGSWIGRKEGRKKMIVLDIDCSDTCLDYPMHPDRAQASNYILLFFQPSPTLPSSHVFPSSSSSFSSLTSICSYN